MTSPICLTNQIRRMSQTSLERLRPISSHGLVWRANENDPRKHCSNHEALFYQMPCEAKDQMRIFGHITAFSPKQHKLHQTLGMIPVMVRQPFLDTKERMEKIQDSEPNVKILLHGDPGHGKTHTLCHLVHYLHLCQTHIVIHIADMRKFTRSPQDLNESSSRPGRIDTPINAAFFLQRFRLQNADLLEKLNDTLVCSKDYNWSSREVTKAGEPIANIAAHGVNRVNHASDCVAVLIKELMLAADEGKIKLAAIYNYAKFLYERVAGVQKHADKKKLLVEEITVARALRKLIQGKQKNSVLIAGFEDIMTNKRNQSPRELLGVEGWNEYNPDLCVHVPKYSRKEFESCMNFYQDIGWLSRPESRTQEVRDEVRFISGLNPAEVDYICRAL